MKRRGETEKRCGSLEAKGKIASRDKKTEPEIIETGATEKNREKGVFCGDDDVKSF